MTLRRRQPHFHRHFEFLDHACGNFVLDGEDVDEIPVVGFGPEVCVAVGGDELRRDANRVSGPAHRALEYVRDAELLRDFRNVQVRILELEGRGAGDDTQAINLCKQVQQFLGDAFGKEIPLGIGAHIPERQHRDRLVAKRLDDCLGPARLRRCIDSRRIPRRVDDEGMCCEQGDRNHERSDNDAVEASVCLRVCHRVARIPNQPFGCQLEDPGQDEGRQDADCQNDNEDSRRRFVEAEQRQDRLGYLHQQPGSDEIGGADAQHVAALKLCDDRPSCHAHDLSIARRVFPLIRIASTHS